MADLKEMGLGIDCFDVLNRDTGKIGGSCYNAMGECVDGYLFQMTAAGMMETT